MASYNDPNSQIGFHLFHLYHFRLSLDARGINYLKPYIQAIIKFKDYIFSRFQALLSFQQSKHLQGMPLTFQMITKQSLVHTALYLSELLANFPNDQSIVLSYYMS